MSRNEHNLTVDKWWEKHSTVTALNNLPDPYELHAHHIHRLPFNSSLCPRPAGTR